MKCRFHLVLVVLALSMAPGGAIAGEPPVSYTVNLWTTTAHLAKVTMTIPEATPGSEIQFPAWNALYQIRDFVRNVQNVEGRCDQQPARLARLGVDTWRAGDVSCGVLEIRYEVFLNEDGVFSSDLDEDHAYLNLAMVLFYLPRERARGVRVRYEIPARWKVATLLPGPDAEGWFAAANYDELVDSPTEAGTFQDYHYQQGGAEYRIVVHAERKVYDENRLVESVKKITAAGTALMQDVPFSRYTFIYHFARESTGGMEHRDGTAISISSKNLDGNWIGLEGVTAHEFMHAWNVKRIRPQALEPVDYIHGNDTSELWFCEGVDSTLSDYVLLRAGLISRKSFLEGLVGTINALRSRPARGFQSVEDSGREAWLEKYSDYKRPERSISYYIKGQIVGVLLDLAIRQESGSRHSIDDLFRRLNTDFAKQGRFYTREDMIRILYELVPTGYDFRQFISDYVSGTREPDYGEFFSYAGLGTPGASEENGADMIKENKKATPEQRRLREHWLNGTTIPATGDSKP
jgi:predicted metalloprotease with PDZ domain